MIGDVYTVAVGDTVTVHTGGRYTHTGIVTKVGPKRVHIDEGGMTAQQYQRENQQRCDGYPGHFETMAQAADREARAAAVAALRTGGVELLTHRHDWTTAQLGALLEAVQAIRR